MIEKKYKNKKWLYSRYVIRQMSLRQIASECSKDIGTMKNWLNKHDIPMHSKEVQSSIHSRAIKNRDKSFQENRIKKIKSLWDEKRKVNFPLLNKEFLEKNYPLKIVRDLAEEIKCTKRMIHEALDSYNIKKRTYKEEHELSQRKRYESIRNNTFHNKEWLEEKYKNSCITDISKECGVNAGAISYWLNVFNIPKHDKKTRKETLRIKVKEYWNSLTDKNRKELTIKIHNSKKKNGSYGKSFTEDLFARSLIQNNIKFERQKKYDRWLIDFYLIDYGIYIQFDGDYWHGHLNTIEELEKTEQGKVIIKTMKRDSEQNKAIPNLIRILDSEFNDSLYYSYDSGKCKDEIDKIVKMKGDYFSSPMYNKIVLTYQPSFYEEENKRWKHRKIKEKIIKNRCSYLNKLPYELTDKEILRGFKISGVNYGFSHFNPLWIKAFIEEYSINSIYDPCAGWGHRLLGANNIKYIGNDIDTTVTNGLFNIAKEFNLRDKIIYNYDSSEFIPKERYEAVFTCPPYFNLEKYSSKETSTNKYPVYSDWLNLWWKNTVRNSLVNCSKYFCYVICDKYKEDMNKTCVTLGLTKVKEIELGSSKKVSHFNRANKKEKVKSDILVIFML